MEYKGRLEMLLEAGSILHSALDLNSVLNSLMDVIKELIPSEGASIYLLDREKDELEIKKAKNGDVTGQYEGLRFKLSEGLCGEVASSGKPLMTDNVTDNPLWNSLPDRKTGFKTKAILAVPMKHNNIITGVVQVINKIDGLYFNDQDLRLFQGFANIAANAIENASRFQKIALENDRLRGELNKDRIGIVGNSVAIKKIIAMIQKIARTSTTVLITGKSGTGKEVVAKNIHLSSDRKDSSFYPLNCGALPEQLLESELFGYEKGAFTGADKQRKGIFEEASGGTLFLDEIGETTAATQVKLLRALQEGKIKRIGSNVEIDIDVRIIAATNKDLKEQIIENKMREDLYYRLNVLNIKIPDLNTRAEDIPLLANYFLNKSCQKMNKDLMSISADVMKIFYTYEWPGNVRELENCIESSVAMSEGLVLEIDDLPPFLTESILPQTISGNLPVLFNLDFDAAKEEFENHYFSGLLNSVNGNLKLAAEKAKVSEKSVARRKKKFNLGK